MTEARSVELDGRVLGGDSVFITEMSGIIELYSHKFGLEVKGMIWESE